MAMTAAQTLRLEKKDKLIASLREKIANLKAGSKTRRVSARGQGGDTASTAAATGKSTRRPASTKGRTRAGARSARRRASVAPSASV